MALGQNWRYFGEWHAVSSRVETIELGKSNVYALLPNYECQVYMLYCLQSWRHISGTMSVLNVLESCG
jgi:hypothetical protein